MAKENTITTLSINKADAEKFDRLAKANKISKKELFTLLLDYLEKYGINPVTQEPPSKEMEKLIKRLDQVVAFIRTQEKDILRPLAAAVNESELRIKNDIDKIAKNATLTDVLKQVNTLISEYRQKHEQAEREREDMIIFFKALISHLDPKGKEGLMTKVFKI